MRNPINLILFALLFTTSVSLFSQSTTHPLDFSQLISDRFERQVTNFPQEKLYVQTDKPYYSAGEEIWFKAYLVNETTLESNSLSQFVYVELIDKMDSVLYRVKIKKDSTGFAGHIKLKSEIPSGTYSLRAYTYWMQNVGNDFFFSKNILIGNKIDDRISSKISYGTAVDGLIPATLTFIDAAQNPIAGKRIDIKQNWDSAKKKKFSMITAKDGTIKWQMAIDPKDDSKKDIQVSMDGEKYKTNISLPGFSSDFDVQFFPESGNLLDNTLQCIAFKAIGKDGLSVGITGKVFTDKNEDICELSTLVKGMGKFSMKTQPNERYYALVKRANGIEKRVELPKTQTTGAAIQLVYNRGKILYKVTNQTQIPNESLYLLLHSRGKVFVVQPLRDLEGQISESLLPAGIVSFSVIDSLGNAYCERLSFVRNFNFPAVSMQSDKPAYAKRELVNLNLKVLSPQGNPVKGNFAISVTDQKTVKQDSLADNIISNLLLTSDIKGYVEEPETYFVDNKTATREKTDVLMLTQGWRRFNTADIVKASYQPSKFYLEAGQVLSGKVINLFNKPSKKCGIIMIPSYTSNIKLAQTDSLGRYSIDGIQFPDSSSFILKAKKKKTLGDVEIIPDLDVFPKPTVYIPTPLKANVATVEQDEYFKQSKEKYFTEGGMRVVNLGEVTVKAAKKETDFIDPFFPSGFEDAKMTSEKLKQFPDQDVLQILPV
ncbi:MAG TPA: MG2 domain-containing protein, partial [Paludibacter sp.]|nr:MG2 domain-containing protein [Paludibacter sp.]